MTVDELLGPELTAELGIEEPNSSDPVVPPSEAPTEVLPGAKKPAPAPAAKPTEPVPHEDGPTTPGPAADEDELEDDDFGEELRTAVMDKPALDQLKAELQAEGGGKPVPAPIKPPSEGGGKAARVPLPPPPGGKPLTRGRIPSITPKDKPANTNVSGDEPDATDDETADEIADERPSFPPATGFDSEALQTRIDYKVPDFSKDPLPGLGPEPPTTEGSPEGSTPGWPDVIPPPETSQPAAVAPAPVKPPDPDNPFDQIPVDQTVQLDLGQLKPRAELSAPADVDLATAPLPADDSEVSVPHPPGTLPRFPRDEARIFWSALKSWGRALPIGYKVAGIALPAVALLGGLLLLVLLAAPSTERGYMVADHNLLAIPSAENALYGSVGTLARNEQVLILDRIGTFVLVRDPEGRVGWVQESYLSEAVPPIGPDLEFTRCFRRTNEDTVKPCQERARFQAEHCMGHCEGLDNPTPCQVDCQNHLTKCENSCPLTLRELQAATVPEPAPVEYLEAEGATTSEEGAETVSEPEAVPEEEEELQPKKKKKKRKKKKKKKKKR